MVKPAKETTRRKVTIFNYPHRIPYPNKAHATKIVMGWMIMVVLPIFITVVRVLCLPTQEPKSFYTSRALRFGPV